MAKKPKKTDWREGGKDIITCDKNEGAVLTIHHKSEPQCDGFIAIVTNCGPYPIVGKLFPAAWPDGLKQCEADGRKLVADYVKRAEDARRTKKEAKKAHQTADKAFEMALT